MSDFIAEPIVHKFVRIQEQNPRRGKLVVEQNPIALLGYCPSQKKSSTRAPASRAISCVRSVLPESTTMTSAKRESAARHRGRSSVFVDGNDDCDGHFASPPDIPRAIGLCHDQTAAGL